MQSGEQKTLGICRTAVADATSQSWAGTPWAYSELLVLMHLIGCERVPHVTLPNLALCLTDPDPAHLTFGVQLSAAL